ncbi:MAG: hypothetical protein KDA86_21200 [Planctomycetaceae bacterium]|nr:hypothetical protein [Planctomycetaceae bacterium]
MRILITGSRAPVALDLSRRFHRAGHMVFHADSLRNGIGMWSNSVARVFHVPRPVNSPRQYVEALAAIVEEHRVDLLIPTCEEVFFIAAHRALLNCQVLVDDFEKLAEIHNKWSFSQSAGNEHASPPETGLVDCCVGSNLARGLPSHDTPADWVFKPVYSRFASRTLIGPTIDQLQTAGIGQDEPWVAQRRIRGKEYSTYSVAQVGRMKAHVTYESLYRAGRGSGILFQPVQLQVIDDFVATFVASRRYTGQIGFDFMRDDDGRFWVLEANPRATSGVHLFAQEDSLVDVLIGNADGLLRPSTMQPAMVELAMPFWGLCDAIRERRLHRMIADMLRSRFTAFSARDPWPTIGLLPALVEIAAIAWKEGRTLQQASTFDIEWNGGPM